MYSDELSRCGIKTGAARGVCRGSSLEDRRGKCTENEADWFTFPGIRCCPIGEGHAGETGAEDTKVKRGNRENGNNKGRRRTRQPLLLNLILNL